LVRLLTNNKLVRFHTQDLSRKEKNCAADLRSKRISIHDLK